MFYIHYCRLGKNGHPREKLFICLITRSLGRRRWQAGIHAVKKQIYWYVHQNEKRQGVGIGMGMGMGIDIKIDIGIEIRTDMGIEIRIEMGIKSGIGLKYGDRNGDGNKDKNRDDDRDKKETCLRMSIGIKTRMEKQRRLRCDVVLTRNGDRDGEKEKDVDEMETGIGRTRR